MNPWTSDDIPDQTGKLSVVTGANSGLGEVTARELARHGARVVLAVRDAAAGEDAAAAIRSTVPRASVEVRELDLASLRSVRRFAATLERDETAIDLLVNNAGVMRTPQQQTEDGFERQLGTNHLGHFALTGLMLGLVQAAPAGRVVTVSSTEHKPGLIDLDDLQLAKSYAPRKAYQQSKLATTMFGIELDRRLRAAGSPAISVLAHPGVANTKLATNGPTGLSGVLVAVVSRLLSQPAARGALPQLYAATAPDVEGGAFFGPRGMQESRGDVTHVTPSARAQDLETGRRLWAVSEELTGVTFNLRSAAGAPKA